MKITLRSARKLEAQLQELLKNKKNVLFKNTVEVRLKDEISDITKSIANAEASFLNDKKSTYSLLELMFEIRRKIEQANEEKGLNSLMNQRMLKTIWKNKLEEMITDPCLRHELLCDYISQQIAMGTSEKSSLLSRRQSAITAELNFLSEDNTQSLTKESQKVVKEIVKIEERLNELNNSVSIELSKDQVSLLEKYGLD